MSKAKYNYYWWYKNKPDAMVTKILELDTGPYMKEFEDRLHLLSKTLDATIQFICRNCSHQCKYGTTCPEIAKIEKTKKKLTEGII